MPSRPRVRFVASEELWPEDTTLDGMAMQGVLEANACWPLRSLASLLSSVSKGVAVLKMDIEHAEYEFIDKEAHLLKKVGQFLVEFHKFDGKERNIIDYIEKIEKQGMRLFHKENNLSDGCCTELAFIRKDWEDWEKQKY